MRNNVFLIITILLVGGLFSLGIKNIGRNNSIPDRRGTYKSPTNSINYSSRQSIISSQQSADYGAKFKVQSSRSLVRPIADQGYGSRFKVQGSKTHPNPSLVGRPTTYNSRPTTFPILDRRGRGGRIIQPTTTLHTSSSAQTHSVGGGTESSRFSVQGSINGKSSAGSYSGGYSGGGLAFALPTVNNSSLLALNSATSDEADTRRQLRTLPRIGYTTQNIAYNGVRKRAPYYDEGDGKWYDDETGDEVHPGSNIPGLDAGGYVGQTISYGGKNYQWNGSEWVDVASDPLPVGNGVWILLLLAMAYAVVQSLRFKVQSSKE